MLGMLGLVFSDAGVGKAVAYVTTTYINMDIKFIAVAVYVGRHGAVHHHHGQRRDSRSFNSSTR